MRVGVLFLGSLKAIAGRKGLEVELPYGARVSTLLGELSKIPNLAKYLSNPASGNLIIVDGVEIGNLHGLETPLVDGSGVVLVPVTHGGS